MAVRMYHTIKKKLRRMDLFTLFLSLSVILHGIGYGAYFFSSMPAFPVDDDIYDAKNLNFKDVDIDFINIPLSVPIGGAPNPAPVAKEQWIEGTGKDAHDAENTDAKINKLSGNGTDTDGYMFADLSDHPPVPIVDFDLNKYFPPAARSANITRKTVLVQMQINEDGSD